MEFCKVIEFTCFIRTSRPFSLYEATSHPWWRPSPDSVSHFSISFHVAHLNFNVKRKKSCWKKCGNYKHLTVVAFPMTLHAVNISRSAISSPASTKKSGHGRKKSINMRSMWRHVALFPYTTRYISIKWLANSNNPINFRVFGSAAACSLGSV